MKVYKSGQMELSGLLSKRKHNKKPIYNNLIKMLFNKKVIT